MPARNSITSVGPTPKRNIERHAGAHDHPAMVARKAMTPPANPKPKRAKDIPMESGGWQPPRELPSYIYASPESKALVTDWNDRRLALMDLHQKNAAEEALLASTTGDPLSASEFKKRSDALRKARYTALHDELQLREMLVQAWAALESDRKAHVKTVVAELEKTEASTIKTLKGLGMPDYEAGEACQDCRPVQQLRSRLPGLHSLRHPSAHEAEVNTLTMGALRKQLVSVGGQL